MTQTKQQSLGYFLIFLVIGTIAVAIDYGFYFLFVKRFAIPIMIAKVLSTCISVSVNYALNSTFNFGNKQKISTKYYLAYMGIYAGLIALNAVINWALFQATQSLQLAFWTSTAISAIVNFMAVKLFFRYING